MLNDELWRRVVAAKSADGDFVYAKVGVQVLQGEGPCPDLCKKALESQLMQAKVWLWGGFQRARACPAHLLRGSAFEGLRFLLLPLLDFDTVGKNQIKHAWFSII